MPKILQQWRLTWSFNKGTMEWGEKSGWWAPKAWLLGWCWDENIWECWNILVDTCDWLSQHAHWFSPRNEREGSFNRNSIHCVLPCFLISLVCNLTWQYQISSLLEHVHLSICLGLQLQLLWRLQINICYITLKARLKIESRSQLRERMVVDILSLSAIIPWSDHLGPPSLSWDTDHAALFTVLSDNNILSSISNPTKDLINYQSHNLLLLGFLIRHLNICTGYNCHTFLIPALYCAQLIKWIDNSELKSINN